MLHYTPIMPFSRTIIAFILLFCTPASIVFADECDTPVIKAFYMNANPSESISFKDPGAISPYEEQARYNIRNVSNFNFKFFGSGIRSRRTGESVVFACVGADTTTTNAEPQCNCIRPVYYNPKTQQVYSFGHHLAVPEGYSLKDTLRNEMNEQTQTDGVHIFKNRFLAPLVRNSKPFSSKAGWNWSVSPKAVSDHKFLKIVNTLNGGWTLAEKYKLELFLHDQNDFYRNYILNQYMVRFATVGN